MGHFLKNKIPGCRVGEAQRKLPFKTLEGNSPQLSTETLEKWISIKNGY